MTKRKWFTAVFAAGVLAPSLALAWWNGDWSERRQLSLDGAASGVTETVERAPTLVRLHSGVLDFTKVRQDGADLRFVSGDDKTPLNFQIERFDSSAELGFVWVDLPRVAANARQSVWMYYGAPNARATSNGAQAYDGEQALVVHFGDGVPSDATANANRITSTAEAIADGMIAGGARFASNSQLRVASSQSLSIAAGGSATFAAWIRIAEGDAAPEATVLSKLSSGGEGAVPRMTLALSQNTPVVRIVQPDGSVQEARASLPLAVGSWSHLTVVADGAMVRLYVDGVQVSEVAAALPELAGDTLVGSASGAPGFTGDIDELGQANTARSASWIAFVARTQGRGASFVAFAPEPEAAGGHENHFGVLLAALTPDAWAVIGVLGLIGLMSFWVIFEKVRLINATAAADRRFEGEFRDAMRKIVANGRGAAPSLDPARHGRSSLFRMYEAGTVEVSDQVNAAGALDDKSVAIVRASLTAQMSKEMQRLNRFLVILTIAISGGPFLGLLGTVVGVMITFAAIAAAGDVNINAIAPGVAAALLATVAGLAVAIPSLFGYNYLITRIQALTADMEVFVDEFVTKIAKAYS